MSSPMSNQRILPLLAVAVLAASLSINFVHADDDSEEGSRAKYSGENRGKPLQPKQSNALFQQECSSCHIAYAPGLLPAASWRKMMTGLDKHFGSDASLDARGNQEITDFLVKHSSNRWSAATAPLRITESAWFTRKHDAHEIDPAVWKNPQVKSPANCAACHPQAERGNFNEDDISIPK